MSWGRRLFLGILATVLAAGLLSPAIAAAATLARPRSISTWTSGTGAVGISWSAVKKANHYHLEIFRSGKWRVVKSQRGRSTRLTGLVPGGRYSVRARAVTKKNKAGKASMTVYAWPGQATPSPTPEQPGDPGTPGPYDPPLVVPVAPVPVADDPAPPPGEPATIRWAPVSGATGYEYRTSLDPALVPTVSPLVLSDLQFGTLVVEVRATSNAGAGPWAEVAITVVATPATEVPGSAPILAASPNPALAGSTMVSWPAVAGADSYEYWSSNYKYFGTTASRYKAFSGFKGCVRVLVSPLNSQGNGPWAEIVVVSPTDPPSPITVMPNPVGYHTAHVSWPGVQGALPGGAPAYEFRINGGASETDYVTGSDGTVFADADGLILGNNTFEARALVGTDGVQAWSGWSSATIVRTAAAPIGAVPAPAASPNPAPAGTTSVIWSQTEGAIRYEYKVGDGPIVATANANPSAIVSGLKGYATVSVRAVTATTVGPWGSVRVLAPPPKPTGLTSTPNPLPAGSGRADISWNVVPEADGYMTRFDGNTIDARIVGGRDNTLIYLQVYGYLPTFTYEVRAYADGIYPQRLYSDWVLVTVVMLPSDD